jgi:sec-independent protein translocase protein TatB
VFDLSPEKLFVVGVIAFIVLGPERLPAMARKAGRLLAQARQVSGGFRQELQSALSEPRDALSSAAEELGLPGISGIPRVPSVRSVLTGALLDPSAGGSTAQSGQASASGGGVASVEARGTPPAPDDPTLN